jgi:hypothetical protein
MSITPEIELDGNFPECPSCCAEIDTWPVEKRATERERERIIALIEREWESEAMASNAGCEWLIALIKGEEQ